MAGVLCWVGEDAEWSHRWGRGRRGGSLGRVAAWRQHVRMGAAWSVERIGGVKRQATRFRTGEEISGQN